MALRRSLEYVGVRFGPTLSSEAKATRLQSLLPSAAIQAVERSAGKQVAIVRIANSKASQAGAQPQAAMAEAQGSLQTLKASADVTFAFPVLVNPATGNRLLVTDEILARLRPGVSASEVADAYDLTLAEHLWRTTDQVAFRLRDPKSQDPLAVANALAESDLVKWAEPNFIQEYTKSGNPNDPQFGYQWHLQNTGQSGGTTDADVDAPGAWDTTTGSSAITIAIIDDGVEKTHPDLAANIFVNPGEVADDYVDNDGNGYVDDVSGWDFSNNDNDASPSVDDDVHGTAVAGVAAARGNNGIGVSGACQTCKILPVKIFTGDAFVSDAALADAIRYAGSLADVLSNSWGGGSDSSVIDDAIDWATTYGRGGKGSVVLFASGNAAGGYWQYVANLLTPGAYTFRWQYTKDASGSAGEDTAWLGWVEFPSGERVDFDSGIPSGWTSGGNAAWTNSTDRNRADEGWCHVRSAKAGTIGNSQGTYIQVTKTVPVGNVLFGAWVSSQMYSDFLEFSVQYNSIWYPVLGDSGVPAIMTSVGYPASYPGTIAVGASTDFDCRASYSEYGPELDVVAPSSGGRGGITTTDRPAPKGYDASSSYFTGFGGTSSATPLVSGVAGLILSRSPNLIQDQVRQILRNTADKVGPDAYVSGRNDRYGYGRVNAQAAVAAATPCSYSLNSSTASSPAVGGSASVGVTAGAGCWRTAVSNAPWITVTSGATGSGSGSVGYTVAANPAGQRSGTITIAGQTFTVNQGAAACSFAINPTSASPSATGGPGSVSVATGSWCGWSAVSLAGWITVTSGASGTGNGAVGYTVATNTGGARSGAIAIADKTFTVSQAAMPTVSIGNGSVTEGDSGTKTMSIDVTVSPSP